MTNPIREAAKAKTPRHELVPVPAWGCCVVAWGLSPSEAAAVRTFESQYDPATVAAGIVVLGCRDLTGVPVFEPGDEDWLPSGDRDALEAIAAVVLRLTPGIAIASRGDAARPRSPTSRVRYGGRRGSAIPASVAMKKERANAGNRRTSNTGRRADAAV